MSMWDDDADDERVDDGDGDGDGDGEDGDGEDGEDVGRAPICPSCGVTALPADLANVIDSGFVCENPDCEAFGEPIDSRP